MNYEDFAYDRSKQKRKNARRDLRVTLGSTTAPAPDIERTLTAVPALARLLREASGGRFELQVTDRSTGQTMTSYQALQRVRDAIDARVESGEPAPGYVVRGRYSDGTFRLFRREQDGSQSFAGQFHTYDQAAEKAKKFAGVA